MTWTKLSLIIGLLLAANAQAIELHNVDSIEQAAYEYALKQAQAQYDNPQLVMGSLDSRLRLQACGSDLETFSQTVNLGIGKQTIGVKCHFPVSWTVYVPVKVKVFKSIVVASRSLNANTILTEDDLMMTRRDISVLRQAYVMDINQLVGQQLKYATTAGSALKVNAVKQQKIVRRGEHIMLVASVGTMEVRMSGTAMSDAILGQKVKVKNSSSKRVVEGIVKGPGLVQVIL